jgi:glycine dehydrogenase subunit 1
MRFLAHSKKDRELMLNSIGVDRASSLYNDVPDEVNSIFNLPNGIVEHKIHSYFKELSSKNIDASMVSFFLGGGCYRHHIPASVDHIIQRAEFLTSYTPYQPEISQGTLTTIFEFQSLICELTSMDVSNASLYDGATALAEAALMSARINKKNKVYIANKLNPDYHNVLRSYIGNENIILNNIDNEISAIIVQLPDYYGSITDINYYRELCDKHDALLIVVNTEILAFGMIEAPFAADIVVGEAQSLGVGMNFGGPHLGYFTCKKEYLRQMPGRICGMTTDKDGNRGFVLTLNAREQHIRRSKATSNICSNQGLNMVAFTIHLSLLGKYGLKKLARLNHYRSVILYNKLKQINNIKILNDSFFNEFVIELPITAKSFLDQMLKNNIMAGIEVDKNKVLVTVTELNSEESLDNYAEHINRIL